MLIVDRISDVDLKMVYIHYKRPQVLEKIKSCVVRSKKNELIKKKTEEWLKLTVSIKTGSVRTGGDRYCSLTRFSQPKHKQSSSKDWTKINLTKSSHCRNFKQINCQNHIRISSFHTCITFSDSFTYLCSKLN